MINIPDANFLLLVVDAHIPRCGTRQYETKSKKYFMSRFDYNSGTHTPKVKSPNGIAQTDTSDNKQCASHELLVWGQRLFNIYLVRGPVDIVNIEQKLPTGSRTLHKTNNKVLQIHNLYQHRALSERSRYCIKYSDFYYTQVPLLLWKAKQDWEMYKKDKRI